MANKIYPKYRAKRLRAGFDATHALDSAEGVTGVYCVLVDTSVYTYSDAHEFYSSLSGIVGSEVEITGKTITDTANGAVFDGNNVTFPSVTGNSAEAVIFFRKNAGANITWPLIGYQDTGVTGLPVTPNGGNIDLVFNASGIFYI